MLNPILLLIIYVAIIMLWSIVVKRNMAEGMLVGFLSLAALTGSKSFEMLTKGLQSALQNEVLYASLAFIFMSFIMVESGIIFKILKIFNAAIGGIKGGPAFVNVGISALFGMLSGSNSANTATSGAFTAQWMINTGWEPATVATLLAGNGGLGAGFPPSASMFIMLGFAEVADLITEQQLYIGLFISGIYQVIYRIFLIRYLMKKNGNIVRVSANDVTIKEAFQQNKSALLVFLGAIIPILVTVGPIKEVFVNIGLGAIIEEISLLTWIPTLMISIVLILGWKELKDKVLSVDYCAEKLFPQYKTIGGVLLFAFAASYILAEIGLTEELSRLFTSLNLPQPVMVTIVALLVVIVAGPLSSTATLTSLGLVSFTALISAGVHPINAVVAILVFASTEGASPPASGSIFIASSLAQVNPEKSFIPLIKYFVLPILIIGWLIAMGFLPLFV